MSFNEAVVNRVTSLLKERGMTRYRLQITSGISHGHMHRIMKDNRKNITLKTVALLAKGFDMTLSEVRDHPLFSYDNLDIEEN